MIEVSHIKRTDMIHVNHNKRTDMIEVDHNKRTDIIVVDHNKRTDMIEMDQSQTKIPGQNHSGEVSGLNEIHPDPSLSCLLIFVKHELRD